MQNVFKNVCRKRVFPHLLDGATFVRNLHLWDGQQSWMCGCSHMKITFYCIELLFGGFRWLQSFCALFLWHFSFMWAVITRKNSCHLAVKMSVKTLMWIRCGKAERHPKYARHVGEEFKGTPLDNVALLVGRDQLWDIGRLKLGPICLPIWKTWRSLTYCWEIVGSLQFLSNH